MAPCDADRVHGRRIIEGFQGPALLLGGSLGRVDTTGRGGYQVLRHLEGDLGLKVSGGLGLRDITTSATPGIPQVWDHAPGNTAFDWKNGDKAIVEEASHVVELDLVKNRVVAIRWNAAAPSASTISDASNMREHCPITWNRHRPNRTLL